MINKWLSRIGVVILYLISLLPFWILYLISDLLYIVLYYITGYRKKVVSENLRNAFPEKSQQELNAIGKRYYRYMGDLIMETVKCISISEKQVRKRLVPINPELPEHYFSQGKSIMAAAAHYCNWELAALRLGLHTDKKRIVVYKQQSNMVFNDFFNRTRSRFGVTMISMRQTLRSLIALKNELTFTVLLSDQTPAKGDVKYFMPFLNQPTAVFLGIEKLIQISDSVLIFYRMDRVKRGYYTCTFVPLIEDTKNTQPYQITEAHMNYLETVIKEKPEYWLWSHRRWKVKPEDIKK